MELTFEKALDMCRNEPHSHFHNIKKIQHIVLNPKYIGKLKYGIAEVLNAKKKRYCEEFDGVPMTYRNVRLLQKFGNIKAEQPFIHFDIEADFIIFRPVVGCTLVGVVNKVSKGHVGCLVHGCFNASIHKPHGENLDWKGAQLCVGDEFNFEVRHLHVQFNSIFIKGVLKDDCVIKKSTLEKALEQLMQPSDNVLVNGTGKNQESDQANESVSLSQDNDSAGQSKKKKKKKKKKKHKKSMSDSGIESISQTEIVALTEDEPDSNGTNLKKKHKNKRKKTQDNSVSLDYEENLQENNTSFSLPDEADLSGLTQVITKKKSKRKHSHSEDGDIVLESVDSDVPVKKKKKKKHSLEGKK